MSPRSDNLELVHTVVDELRAQRDSPEFSPSPDIDMVWVLSAPGTALEESNDGIYSGASYDRINIDYGIRLVQEITAQRLGKPAKDVTKEDIEAHGPVLFYNGEDKNTEKGKYLQNEHLEELIKQPDFPIPRSKVVIDRIPTIATPAQVKGIAEFLRDTDLPHDKIAVVSLFAHAPRVGRYLEHYRDLFPDGIEFVNAPARMSKNALGASRRETKKVVQYHSLGHLARDSWFAKQDS